MLYHNTNSVSWRGIDLPSKLGGNLVAFTNKNPDNKQCNTVKMYMRTYTHTADPTCGFLKPPSCKSWTLSKGWITLYYLNGCQIWLLLLKFQTLTYLSYQPFLGYHLSFHGFSPCTLFCIKPAPIFFYFWLHDLE